MSIFPLFTLENTPQKSTKSTCHLTSKIELRKTPFGLPIDHQIDSVPPLTKAERVENPFCRKQHYVLRHDPGRT
jgi:hypothetical protein